MQSLKSLIAISLAACCFFCAELTNAQGQEYHVGWLNDESGTPVTCGRYSGPTSINNNGIISCGARLLSLDGVSATLQAFNGTPIPAGYIATRINSQGDVILSSETSSDPARLFITSYNDGRGSVYTLPGRATGLNDNGTVTGYVCSGSGCEVYIKNLETGADMRFRSPAAGAESFSSAINNHDVAAGGFDTEVDPVSGIPDTLAASFILSNGNVVNLGHLGGGVAAANDINDKGDVVGSSTTDRTNGSRAPFLVMNGGTMSSLGHLPLFVSTTQYPSSTAVAISESGEVVGSSTGLEGAQYSTRAFIYHQSGGMRDLNSLTNSHRKLERARDINDCGQILGTTFNQTSGKDEGWVLTPRNTAMVFDPDPYSSSNNPALFTPLNSSRHMNNADSIALNFQRRCVRLKGLRPDVGTLDGEFVTTAPTASSQVRASDPLHVHIYKRSDPRFEEVMAYYHLDTMIRYVREELGLNGLFASHGGIRVGNVPMPLKVFTRQDNPNEARGYHDIRKIIYLTAFDGSVEQAEDGRIIWHEGAHAIMDDIVNQFATVAGTDDAYPEAAAIQEGFGDYLAYSAFVEKPHLVNESLLSFSSYWFDQSNGRRVINSNLKYSDFQENGDPHINGQIWSRCLYELRHNPEIGVDGTPLGRVKADRLIISALEGLQPNATMSEAANGLLTQNSNPATRYAKPDALQDLFIRREIFPLLKSVQTEFGAATPSSTLTATVHLHRPWSSTVEVMLESSDSNVIVPPFVYVESGSMTASFPISIAGSASRGVYEVRARHGGRTEVVSFEIEGDLGTPSVTLSRTSVTGGRRLTVRVDLPVTASGQEQAFRLFIDGIGRRLYPNLVSIPAGRNSASINIRTPVVRRRKQIRIRVIFNEKEATKEAVLLPVRIRRHSMNSNF